MDQAEIKKTEIWDDAKQLSILVDRATQCDDRLAKVLFESSIQTLEDQQAAQAYRDRINNVLLKPVDQSPAPEQQIDIQRQSAPPTDTPRLRAPRPVVLYEDPLNYKIPNPSSITQMSPERLDQIDEQINQSRDSAIFREEVRHELFKPLVGLVACIALIAFIGTSAYLNSWIGSPQKASAKSAVMTPDINASPTPLTDTATKLAGNAISSKP
ncbi:MAG: hypothetical protein JKX85_00300 [Phycisphaeraceae bacterium]|nr:hypothetical protein [Phycisphaeraceae bacterium]